MHAGEAHGQWVEGANRARRCRPWNCRRCMGTQGAWSRSREPPIWPQRHRRSTGACGRRHPTKGCMEAESAKGRALESPGAANPTEFTNLTGLDLHGCVGSARNHRWRRAGTCTKCTKPSMEESRHMHGGDDVIDLGFDAARRGLGPPIFPWHATGKSGAVRSSFDIGRGRAKVTKLSPASTEVCMHAGKIHYWVRLQPTV
uniref:Uncharacterized protein LOC114914178 n=1 Tax=Elaeis guineensis var. tenera TaxID=51953 RepID=A0A8N4IDJ8_ELAGV|nr:uncharacterized protein LOC114914178 [Elaeis guineensis]